ncbi:MAG: zf-HC2 domain-containing protein [Nitrospirota bacterium]
MKKECEDTRSLLPRYLRGHLFKPQQYRIERHLAECVVCRSEFDSLRRIDETRRFLKDINAPDGVAARMKAGVSGLAGIRKLMFRPLWLIMIAAVIAASYLYVIDPLLHDPDIEKLDAGIPPPPAATAESAQRTLPTPTPPPAVPPPPQQKMERAPAVAAPKADPLVVTITMEKQNEKASIRTINDAMKEHAMLKTMRFSDKVREISGSLTPDELLTFFNRVQSAGKITYKRSRLASAGSELLPFVMKLQTQAPPQTPADGSTAKPVAKPAEIPVERPVSKPVEIPADKPSSKPDDRPAPPPLSPQAK